MQLAGYPWKLNWNEVPIGIDTAEMAKATAASTAPAAVPTTRNGSSIGERSIAIGRSSIAGEKLLLTEEQAKEIGEAFGQRMQAKQIAKAMAEAKSNLEKGQKALAENGKKPGVVTTASGLQYQILTEGKGAKPAATDGVKVHYKGTLLDGKTFDSSYDRGEPAVMPLQGVIPGWVEGLQLMPVGSKYTFWIPAKLAYGEQAPPMIGPNQTLVFEVELLDIVKAPSGK